jgi:formate--tetrahydrofolate ligase
VHSVRTFGFEPVIAINVFANDAKDELRAIAEGCATRNLKFARFTGFTEGGSGAAALAQQVLHATQQPAPAPRFLYTLEQTPQEKITAVAQTIYGAGSVVFSRSAQQELERIVALGYDKLPICIAKTHLSLSADPRRVGATNGFVLPVESLRIAAGAGYLLAITGEIVTMPGLPREPAANGITLNEDGTVKGI